MVPMRDNGLPVRRHPSILRQGRRGAETNQEGDCSTTTRVGEAQSRGESNSSEISEDSRCTTVFVSAGPLESRGCPELLRVQPVPNNRRVVFVANIIVHEETDWPAEDYRSARIGPWMHAAVDRERFSRRIADFEQIICMYLTDQFRDAVKSRFLI